MTESLYANLVRDPDGAWSTAYGPFILRSALQPIFRRTSAGMLAIDGFQGLVRAEKNGEPHSPSQFLPLVEEQDHPRVDSLLRAIHILNTGLLARSPNRVFVSFTPDHYPDADSLRIETEHLRLAAHEAGLPTESIICDISFTLGRSADMRKATIDALRNAGFSISLSDYGSGDEDIERAVALNPTCVKFDGYWVRNYMHNPAGLALLRVAVRQFVKQGIEPLFERLEEMWQVELCEEIGVPLMQGYALARPQLVPTNFNAQFPEHPQPFPRAIGDTNTGNSAPDQHRPHPVFGKRQA